jgi:hypothetical protein
MADIIQTIIGLALLTLAASPLALILALDYTD